MRQKHSLLAIAALALVLVLSAMLPRPSADKDALLIKGILDGLNMLHYMPQKVDDEFSNKVFDLYLDRIDGQKRFLTKDDIAQLEKYRKDIDDEASKGQYTFFDLSNQLIDVGIARAKGYFEAFIEADLDFDEKDFVEIDAEKLDYPRDYKAQKARWQQMIKLDILSRYYAKLKKQEEQPEAQRKSDAELMADARKEVRDMYAGWFKRMEKTDRQDRLDIYLNTITNVYDPHTNYFAPIEKENFDIGMSGQLKGIGARLQSDGEETKVVEIVPGSPSWKQGDLKPDDIIIKVAQGEAEPVDVSGMKIDDVVQLIRGEVGTEVRLTVRKQDGSTKEISIVRDVVVMEDGLAKSLILEHDNMGVGKLGYIKLPRFYVNFEDRTARSCADDVRSELEKLKAQGVSGIIIDLRDNGGGSLDEVVRMSGLFIEKGPIVQAKNRHDAPEVLRDRDPSVIYDGPLVIMVNAYSASASEILAAALQDYGRAVIVGGKSTFGKGTVQTFVDLDRLVNGNTELKPFGSVKMTIKKFYRINGGATQLRGVVPDIPLPDALDEIEVGERSYDYSMPWTQIAPLEYEQGVFRIKDMAAIKARSQARVAQSQAFRLIRDNAQDIKTNRERSRFPLRKADYIAEQREADARNARFDNIMETAIPGLRAQNLAEDDKALDNDESGKARNNAWLESLHKDVYLEEAMYVLQDLIRQ